MTPLTDKDRCPVSGEQFGKLMENVPAGFLDWLGDQPWAEKKYPEVVDYINRNRKVIDMELEEQGRM